MDIWQHLSETCSNKKPLTIWVGTPEEVQKQLNEVYEKAGLDPQTTDFLKFVPNIALLEEIENSLQKNLLEDLVLRM